MGAVSRDDPRPGQYPPHLYANAAKSVFGFGGGDVHGNS